MSTKQSNAIDIPFIEDQYAVVFQRPEQFKSEFSFLELTNSEVARSLLLSYAEVLKASDITPAATYFVSWLRGLSVTAQLLLSAHDSTLDWSISNWRLFVTEEDGRMGFAFHPMNASIVSANPLNGAERDSWRNGLLEDLYSNTLRPIVDTMAQAADLNSGQLWALMASGMYYCRERLLTVYGEDSPEFAQVEADYRFTMQEMKGTVFGRSRNPLAVKFRLVENPRCKGEMLPLKASCCLAYKTEGHGYCYTCPKLSEEQRLERGRELAAKAAH
ncbi:(2Fe-2S)-binding protein [Paenibacillus oenotherae]|uniref:(2Fe-2S)-binding protein n=1 Tax=Paenibacillus oenotherae TaxID=1435645 RepID=A0ABS7D8S4_9BACL|nr:(2Fe-2S)-binding protein [Paenibacillus oenotherae]MBW7476275.1 (2Fe-2S)-binding protein [Paenibacillus oenotherae]